MSTTINPNKALWEKGDFTRISESMRESGEALVATLGITDGMGVLDLGQALGRGVSEGEPELQDVLAGHGVSDLVALALAADQAGGMQGL